MTIWVRCRAAELEFVIKYKRGVLEHTGTKISVAEMVKNDISVTK